MATIRIGTREVEAAPGDSLLVALLKARVNVPYYCQVGSCHTCLMRCVAGAVPAPAQNGLSERQIAAGYFLACQCEPDADMTVVLLDA